MRIRLHHVVLAGLLAATMPAAAAAQGIGIKGYGLVGNTSFTAADSFEAVLGSSSGPIFGGGAEVGLPLGGLYIGVGAWRFEQDGERVFVSGAQVFPLGIPVTVQITPIEVTGGWRFRNLSSRFVPYAGGGWTSYRYKETSSFAAAGEDVDERYSGFHILGGAEFRIARWLGVGGELAWARVPDALGQGGASAAFDETDLGGTSVRLKISLGR